MYLPPYAQDEETGHIYQDLDAPEAAIKHGGSYCPWCNDLGLHGKLRKGCAHDVNSQIFVIDDRLYEYIEENVANPGKMLVHCVKVSQLIRAFTGMEYFRRVHVKKTVKITSGFMAKFQNQLVDFF